MARARSACGHAATYALGAGGYREGHEWPWHETFDVVRHKPDGSVIRSTVQRACDCSGFISWVVAVPRKLDAEHLPGWVRAWGAWMETTQMERDARPENPWGYLARIPWRNARPGCLFLYGDTVEGGVHREGHVGLITEVADGSPTRVVHCSVANLRTHRDAIHETNPGAFLKRGIVAQFMPALVDYSA